MENRKNHLPVYGVGPIYGFCIILATVIAVILTILDIFPSGKIEVLKVPFFVIGIMIATLGFWVWKKAAFRIDKYIVTNELCTDGVYAIVRNPCYSGIMLMCTGILWIAGNLFFLILPFIYWAAMTILMKHTEEKWLYELYGQEYLEYCKKVNRCIPWFRK